MTLDGSLDSRTCLCLGALLVEALDRLLDRLQPAEIDSAASYAIDGSFLLAHRHTPSGDIEIGVGEHDAKIESHFDEGDAITNENDHGLAVQVVDRIARILCGIYRVEFVYWGGRHARTSVTGSIERTKTPEWAVLPVPERFLTRRVETVRYGCNGSSVPAVLADGG